MSKHGENIRKRKDGRWEGRYIKGRKSDRTAIWGYIYGHSYTEVKEKLAIKKMEVQQFALNVENPTFSELSLTWESSIFLGVKSSTAAHYHYTLQHYILPVLGPYRVQALNESILESSLLEIIAPVDQNHKTLGNAMSKECLTLVRRICRYAVHLHIMRPVEIDLKLPTVNSSNTSVLNTGCWASRAGSVFPAGYGRHRAESGCFAGCAPSRCASAGRLESMSWSGF